MTRMRKFVAYRRLDARPFTRKSKYKNRNYVKAPPRVSIVRFDLGNKAGTFDTILKLVSKQSLQIRQNALESARQSVNRRLEKLGDQWHFKLLIYPHHIVRENAFASGAGADRLSTGMSQGYGKCVGVVARVRKGQTIMSVRTNKQHVNIVREYLNKAVYKIPGSYSIVIEPMKKR